MFPVLLMGIFYWNAHAADYHPIRSQRFFLMAAGFILLYGWILVEVVIRKQRSIFQLCAQSSFFLYIFMVLIVTGYFIAFREVSIHHWWTSAMHRIAVRDRVNLELFKMFRIYHLSSIQIVGNFMMLLPLGVYLPVLYKNCRQAWVMIPVAFMISTSIEVMQLSTSYRSCDVDDIFLNTLGAATGFILFIVVRNFSKSSLLSSSHPSAIA